MPTRETDIIVENSTSLRRSLKNATSYPFSLTEEQIVRLIYFFGGRRLTVEASKKARRGALATENFTNGELLCMKDFIPWFGLQQNEFKASYLAITSHFKTIMDFLRSRPAFVTTAIYKALKTCGYESVSNQFVLVIDPEGNVRPRLLDQTTEKKAVPLAKFETMLWDIQSISLDKIQLILQSISPNDIKKATLGNKSKAVRDLYSMLHMARLQQKNPNVALVNINLNSSDAPAKLGAFNQYIQK